MVYSACRRSCVNSIRHHGFNSGLMTNLNQFPRYPLISHHYDIYPRVCCSQLLHNHHSYKYLQKYSTYVYFGEPDSEMNPTHIQKNDTTLYCLFKDVRHKRLQCLFSLLTGITGTNSSITLVHFILVYILLIFAAQPTDFANVRASQLSGHATSPSLQNEAARPHLTTGEWGHGHTPCAIGARTCILVFTCIVCNLCDYRFTVKQLLPRKVLGAYVLYNKLSWSALAGSMDAFV